MGLTLEKLIRGQMSDRSGVLEHHDIAQYAGESDWPKPAASGFANTHPHGSPPTRKSHTPIAGPKLFAATPVVLNEALARVESALGLHPHPCRWETYRSHPLQCARLSAIADGASGSHHRAVKFARLEKAGRGANPAGQRFLHLPKGAQGRAKLLDEWSLRSIEKPRSKLFTKFNLLEP